MQIELANISRMSECGSSILRAMQNGNEPILDLFIREAIQNSIDAIDDKNVAKHVDININIGEFKSKELIVNFEKIITKLCDRYSATNSHYLVIEDKNTVGLTGPIDYEDVEGGNYGNLLKLVYEISKPQSKEGSGGSWGLGKSIYYRVGMGITIYYSRIKKGSTYEERLACCLIEDETKDNALLPCLPNTNIKRGIAWWGEKSGDNKTIPITNLDQINEFLKIFKLRPFKGNETGTKIIIPFIEPTKLLTNNDHFSDEKISRYWMNDINEYLRVAAQRWYANRIDNDNYPHGKYIQLKINNEEITYDNMDPIFQVSQSLYNRCIEKINHDKDYFIDNKIDKNRITINKIADTKYLNLSHAGSLIYVDLSEEELKMVQPNNFPNPYVYYNLDNNNVEENQPILSFCRKPGLTINYCTSGSKWLNGVPNTMPKEYRLCMFVLNSLARFKESYNCIDLENYVRNGEKSDHMEWFDNTYDNIDSITIVKLIKEKVRKLLKNNCQSNVVDANNRQKSCFANDLKAFLPSRNFGHAPSSRQSTKKYSTSLYKKKIANGFEYSISNNIDYTASGILINLDVKTPSKKAINVIDFTVQTDRKAINEIEWKKEYVERYPFEIDNVVIPRGKDYEYLDQENKMYTNDDFSVEIFRNENSSTIIVNSKKSTSLSLEITLLIHSKQYVPFITSSEMTEDEYE